MTHFNIWHYNRTVTSLILWHCHWQHQCCGNDVWMLAPLPCAIALCCCLAPLCWLCPSPSLLALHLCKHILWDLVKVVEWVGATLFLYYGNSFLLKALYQLGHCYRSLYYDSKDIEAVIYDMPLSMICVIWQCQSFSCGWCTINNMLLPQVRHTFISVTRGVMEVLKIDLRWPHWALHLSDVVTMIRCCRL